MQHSFRKSDVIALCGRVYTERGRVYQRAGKVLSIDWDAEEETLIGTVSGSGRNVYEQEILVNVRGGRVSFEGYCSCPVEENCKHVAAVLLAWRSRSSSAAVSLQKPTPAAVPRQAASPWMVWQRQLAEQLAPAAPVRRSRSDGQFLLYVLHPEKGPRGPKVELRLFKSRPLQKGGWGKATAVNWYQLSGSGYGPYGYSPDWLTALDDEVLLLLRNNLISSAAPILAGDLGAAILKRLLRSGRCFLERITATPLSLGPSRRAESRWLTTDQGRQELTFSLAGIEQPWQAIPTDPPWYLDPTGGCCGPIEQPLPASLFHALLRLPPVTEPEIRELGRLMLPLASPGSLPLPIELDIRIWDEPPVPHLQLRGESMPHGQVVHLARLSFAYGPCSLRPWRPGEPLQALADQTGVEWMINRDREDEQRHLETLLQLGMKPAAVVNAGSAESCDLLFCGANIASSAAAWRHFLGEERPRLLGNGWRIETDESFILNFATADHLTARIEEGSGGWFDIGLDLEHQDQRIPLLPLLLQLLAEGIDPTRGTLVAIGRGQWLEVPQQILEPVLATLFELYQRPDLGSAGQLRLPRTLAPWLDELGQRLEAGGIGLSWQGGASLRALAEKLRNFSGIQSVPTPPSLQAKLRPYQQQGLSWLQFLREYGFGGILADDMGLGKTVQTLAHLVAEKEFGRLERPALVVAPTSVLGNWRREAARFAPTLRVLVLHGPERSDYFDRLLDYDLLITSYALIPRDGERLRQIKFSTLILDEAQGIKNARSKVAQATCVLSADQRLCLTGTPMENHLGELWSLFNFLMPGFLGTETTFNGLFRRPVEKHGDSERQRELVRRITPFVLRRNKQEVARELPAKSEIIQSVELEEPQRRLYESIRVAMSEKIGTLLREKGLARSHIEMLDALLKLRQACCDPRLVKLDSARGLKSSAKLELLLAMLTELLEEGRRVLLFSQFTSMLTLIEAELAKRKIRYVKLTGQTRRRDEVVDQFQRGEVPLFLISLKAGGVGLNLTAADTVIHYDPWWNPAVEQQATDRAHRIGQDKPVFVYKLVAADTVEEKILQLQARKQTLADEIYRGGKAGGDALASLDAEEILSLLTR